MPEHVPPRTHQARLVFLHSASQRDKVQALLPETTSAALHRQYHCFDDLFFRELDQIAKRKEQLDQRKAALARLNMLIRHYWQGLRMQVRRGDLPEAAFIDVGLNRAGRNLRLVRRSEKLHAARKLIAGITAMEARGWRPHTQPSVSEIEAVMMEIVGIEKGLQGTELTLLTLRQNLKQEAAHSDRLYHRIFHEIRIALMERTRAEKRYVLRQYGVVFRYRPDRDGNRARDRQEDRIDPQPVQKTQAISQATDNIQPEDEVRVPELKLTREERCALRRRERQIQRRFHRQEQYRRAKKRRQSNNLISHPANPPPQDPSDREREGALRFAQAG